MNVCVVGYGAIGKIHTESLCGVKNAILYAVCDKDDERLRKAVEKYGVKGYSDFYKSLEDDNIDSFHICTPHYLHYEMITEAVKRNKRVVIEKPAVMTKEELDRIYTEIDVTNVYPIIQNRKNICIEKLKELVKSENTGKLLGVKGIMTWKRDADYYNSADWRGTLAYEGGGVLINQAIHTLDLMTYFAGECDTVEATMSNHSLKNVIEVEDTMEAYICYKNGAKGVFYATNAHCVNSSVQFELEYENVSYKYIDGLLISDKKVLCTDSVEYMGKTYWGSGHPIAFRDLYDNGDTLNLNDVRTTMETMFAIYESARKNVVVNL